MGWQRIGNYEFEYDKNGYTGWYRCVGGMMSNNHWPQWNNINGATR